MDRGPRFEAFLAACELASSVLGQRAVAERWREDSALDGLTVGGVASHLYGATRRFEVALDEPVPQPATVVGLAEFYGRNRVDGPDDLESGLHPLVREDAELRAGHGPEAVAERFRRLVSRLEARLADEPPDRLVPVWTVEQGATTLRAYLATRVVELVVHADDLAVSAGLPPLVLPEAAASVVIEVFVEQGTNGRARKEFTGARSRPRHDESTDEQSFVALSRTQTLRERAMKRSRREAGSECPREQEDGEPGANQSTMHERAGREPRIHRAGARGVPSAGVSRWPRLHGSPLRPEVDRKPRTPRRSGAIVVRSMTSGPRRGEHRPRSAAAPPGTLVLMTEASMLVSRVEEELARLEWEIAGARKALWLLYGAGLLFAAVLLMWVVTA